MLIPKVYIRRPLRPGPRRLPRGIAMSSFAQPKFHAKCGKRTLIQFADDQHWCETCGEYVQHERPAAPVRKPQGVTWTTKVLK